jgi:hypothetical protein
MPSRKLWLACATIILMIAAGLLLKQLGRVRASISPCVLNLHNIQMAKEWWMRGNDKTTNDTPTWDDLRECFERTGSGLYGVTNGLPHCPSGGVYTIERVGEPPRCSIGGPDHSLSKDM